MFPSLRTASPLPVRVGAHRLAHGAEALRHLGLEARRVVAEFAELEPLVQRQEDAAWSVSDAATRRGRKRGGSDRERAARVRAAAPLWRRRARRRRSARARRRRPRIGRRRRTPHLIHRTHQPTPRLAPPRHAARGAGRRGRGRRRAAREGQPHPGLPKTWHRLSLSQARPSFPSRAPPLARRRTGPDRHLALLPNRDQARGRRWRRSTFCSGDGGVGTLARLDGGRPRVVRPQSERPQDLVIR